MPLRHIDKTIAGLDIKIEQFPATKGVVLKARLYKMVLPVLGPLMKALKITKKSDGGINIDGDFNLSEVLPAAFSTLAETVDPDKLFALIMDLLNRTYLNNKALNEESLFNETFSGNYNTMYKVVYEVVMFNNFFDFGDIGILSEEAPKQNPVSSDE